MSEDASEGGSAADESKRPRYDLEERTAKFGEAVVRFAKLIPVTEVTRPIIGQLVRAAISVGADYCEADEADTKKEFRYRIGVCRREARESRFQLRMVVAADDTLRDNARRLWQEAKELGLIFNAILRSRKDG
jgi:four helix bundle protein